MVRWPCNIQRIIVNIIYNTEQHITSQFFATSPRLFLSAVNFIWQSQLCTNWSTAAVKTRFACQSTQEKGCYSFFRLDQKRNLLHLACLHTLKTFLQCTAVLGIEIIIKLDVFCLKKNSPIFFDIFLTYLHQYKICFLALNQTFINSAYNFFLFWNLELSQ